MDDPVAQAYRSLAEALRRALARHGLEVTEEHHHSDPAGSHYLVLTGGEQAVCLRWDGKERVFRLECCSKAVGPGRGAWEFVCLERFDPARDGPERVDVITDAVAAAVVQALGAG